MPDDRELAEIIEWFSARGYQLVVHEVAGAWRAPFVLKGVHVGVGTFGSGATPLEAAQDAKRQFERLEPPRDPRRTRSFFITPALIESRAEVSARVIRAGDTDLESSTEPLTPDEKQITAAFPESVLQTITRFDWKVVLEEEPDGSVTGVLQDKDGAFLKMSKGTDFHDAVLELFADTYPPSQEVRREQQRDDS
ncbi:MAG: hypothetical protein ACXVRZ_17350 [Gaiellaceae bacterium]